MRNRKDYQLKCLPDGIPSMSVEVMSTLGWEKYTHEQFGLNRFGASGAYKDVYKVSQEPNVHGAILTYLQKFEFTPEGIAKRAKATVDFYKGTKPRSPVNRAFQQLILSVAHAISMRQDPPRLTHGGLSICVQKLPRPAQAKQDIWRRDADLGATNQIEVMGNRS